MYVMLSETIDVYNGATNLIDLSKIFLSNVVGDLLIGVAGAVTPVEDTPVLVLALTREQSAFANTKSGVAGGDGQAMSLDVQANAFQDLVGLKNLLFTNVTVNEYPDLIPPTVLNVTVDYSKGGTGCGFTRCGSVYIEFSEFIREESIYINTSKVTLANDHNDTVIRLDEAILNSAVGYEMRFTLNEVQRAVAITQSGTRGGDGIPLVLNIEPGFVIDYGANTMQDTRSIFVYEFPDLDPPVLTNATLDLGTGSLVLKADETLDLTPVTAAVVENMTIANVSGDGRINLQGAKILPIDRAIITFMLTEKQRVTAIQISSQTGGDGHPSFFEAEAGSFRDVGLNLLPLTLGLKINETADKIPPELETVEIDYIQGKLRLHFSETIDSTPSGQPGVGIVNLSYFNLFDWNGQNSFGLTDAYQDPFDPSLQRVAFVTEQDEAYINITMTPPMRWAALLVGDLAFETISLGGSIPGGRENFLRMSLLPNSMTDIALNNLFGYGVSNVCPFPYGDDCQSTTNFSKPYGPRIVTDPFNTYIPRFITTTLVEVGDQDIAVVGFMKNWYFNGSGVNSVPGYNDRAKWVPYNLTSNSDCGTHGDELGQGLPTGPLVKTGTSTFYVPKDIGATIAFTQPSPPGYPWKLCYKFADEPWKIFNHVRLEVKNVESVVAHSFGNDTAAVVNYPKPFRFDGYGLGPNDLVTYARNDATTDADCLDDIYGDMTEQFAPGAYDTQYQGASTTHVVDWENHAIPSAYGSVLVKATVNFTRLSPVYHPHFLCYKFKNEPPKLYINFPIMAKQLHSLNGTRALVGSPQTFGFYTQHMTGHAPGGNIGEWDTNLEDQVKWIQPSGEAQVVAASSGYQTSDAVSLCNNEKVAGISEAVLHRHPSRPYADATFTFQVASLLNSPLVLCYRFGSEPYQVYPTMTITSITPRIETVSRSSMVEGLFENIFFGGTTGVTHGDAAKWIPQEKDCSLESGHGIVAPFTPVLPSWMTGTSYENLVSGKFQFLTGPENWERPWKLCFRFGSSPAPFLPYPFFMRVKSIHNVTLLNLHLEKGDVIGVGNRLVMSFGGIGIGHNGGDSMRFVLATESGSGHRTYDTNTSECNAIEEGESTGAGGTPSSIPVWQRQAEIVFQEKITTERPAILCYRFQGEKRYQSFASVPLVYEGMSHDGGHHHYSRVSDGSNSSFDLVEAIVVRGFRLRLKSEVLQDMSLGLQVDNGTGHSARLPMRVDFLEPAWKKTAGNIFAREMAAAMGITASRIGGVSVVATERNIVTETYLKPILVIHTIDVHFEIQPESVLSTVSSGSSEIHGAAQLKHVLESLVSGGKHGMLYQERTLPLSKHIDASMTLPLTPTTHKVMFVVPVVDDETTVTTVTTSSMDSDGGAFSAEGYHPLYATEVDANEASLLQGGGGTSKSHTINGATYWMPLGVTYQEGSHDGYLSEFASPSSLTTTNPLPFQFQHGVGTTSSNPFPVLKISVHELATESVFVLSAPLVSVIEGRTTNEQRSSSSSISSAGTITTTETKIQVKRQGSIAGTWLVSYSVRRGEGGTATSGSNATGSILPANADFLGVGVGTLTFLDGEEGPKEIVVHVVSDERVESSYETLEVILLSVEGTNVGLTSSLGALSTSVVRIYDYYDGHSYVVSEFNSTGGSATYQQGWDVTNNGAYSPTWVDVNGLYSVDQMFSTRVVPHATTDHNPTPSFKHAQSYERPTCPTGVTAGAAIVLDCDLSCVGDQEEAQSPDVTITTKVVSSRPDAQTVLGSMGTPITLDGVSGSVSTAKDVELPHAALTVALWVRTSDVQRAGMLVSFVSNKTMDGTQLTSSSSNPSFYHEFGLYDQRAMRVIVQDRVDGTWRVPALETLVSANDGEWNHVAVTWRSSDGAVAVYKNGVQSFITSGYRTGHLMSSRGRIVVGRGALDSDLTTFAPSSGLEGEVQNVRVYRTFLSQSGIVEDMSWPFTPRAPDGHLHLVMYWRFSTAYYVGNPSNGLALSSITVTNLADDVDPQSPDYVRRPVVVSSGGAEDYSGGMGGGDYNDEQWLSSNYTGYTSIAGVSIGTSTSTGTLSPCVEDAVWYFSTPMSYLSPRSTVPNSTLLDIYDGRLQFEMKAASTSGILRPRRGMVELYSDQAPFVISHALPDGFTLPTTNHWTAYSVVLREDMGWRTEPTHRVVSHHDMVSMLSSATAIRIRGDHWICDANGDGQEATYINHVRIESPQLKRVEEL